MKTNVLTLIITLVVGVILAGSLLAPVISDATETERTVTNDGGLFTLNKINAADDFTLEYDYTAPNQITVNDEVIQLNQGAYPLTVFFNDTLMIRVAWSDNISVFETNPETGAYALISAGVSAETNMTVTNDNGTLTITNGTTTVERTNTNGMIAANGGAYIMKGQSEQVYLTGDTEFYASGYTYRALGVANSSFVGIFKGTINDGITAISQVPTTYSITNETETYTQVTGEFKDLYKFSGFGFTLTDGTNSGNVSYNQLIVPVSVSAELTNHLTPGQISLMGAIPVMVIVALLMAAVGAIALRRAD